MPDPINPVLEIVEGIRADLDEAVNDLGKRIDDARDFASESEARLHEKLHEIVKAAVESAAINKADLVEEIVAALTDGSHVLVTRPATFTEQRGGRHLETKEDLEKRIEILEAAFLELAERVSQ